MKSIKSKKLWAMIGAAALVVILLVLLTLNQTKIEDENRIVLPPENSATATQPDTESISKFTEINVSNVQTIIEGLQRPASYHQTLEVSSEFDGSIRSQSVDIWKSGAVYHIITEETSGTRNLLTDGKLLYLWYAGDMHASSISLDESISSDDLIGIPTYEDILNLPLSQIEEANFVSLSELDNQSCVFISTRLDNTAEYYWVSLSSGLLCRQTSLYNNSPVRSAKQSAFEAFSGDDPSFAEHFALPDGSVPFAIQK